MSDNVIKVLLVEDHKCILWGLEKLIESTPRMQVVGKANNRAETLNALNTTKPDVVLLDVDLNGENSIDFMPDILGHEGVKVLVLTGVRDMELRQRAMVNGALGFVAKDEPAEVILRAIECVHRGEIWLDRTTTASLIGVLSKRKQQSDPEAEKIASLTPRELKVISALVEERGAHNRVVAVRLNMSESTLRNHLTAIYSKLDVENRLSLVLYATRHGLAGEPAKKSFSGSR